MSNIEEKLVDLMEDGWNISIECKAKGRNYELSYEVFGHNYNKKLSINTTTFKGELLEDAIDKIITFNKRW